MNRTLILSLIAVAILVSACSSSKQARTFGLAPTLKEGVAINAINSEPAKYATQDVLITGTVSDICRHAGCWVEIEQADHSKIICKSVDESVLFPVECLGKEISLQGSLLYDPAASGSVEKQHEGEEAHACPAPQVMVSIKGATVKGL